MGFSGGSVVMNPPANEEATEDAGLIPGSGRSPGGGRGNSLQYSSLGNPLDKGACWVTVHGVAESDMIEHACRDEFNSICLKAREYVVFHTFKVGVIIYVNS